MMWYNWFPWALCSGDIFFPSFLFFVLDLCTMIINIPNAAESHNKELIESSVVHIYGRTSCRSCSFWATSSSSAFFSAIFSSCCISCTAMSYFSNAAVLCINRHFTMRLVLAGSPVAITRIMKIYTVCFNINLILILISLELGRYRKFFDTLQYQNCVWYSILNTWVASLVCILLIIIIQEKNSFFRKFNG